MLVADDKWHVREFDICHVDEDKKKITHLNTLTSCN